LLAATYLGDDDVNDNEIPHSPDNAADHKMTALSFVDDKALLAEKLAARQQALENSRNPCRTSPCALHSAHQRPFNGAEQMGVLTSDVRKWPGLESRRPIYSALHCRFQVRVPRSSNRRLGK
jgi:hypothetical protein